MKNVVDPKVYYSWEDVFFTESEERAFELEVIFYKLKIPARVVQLSDQWVLRTPWTKAELAKNLAEAFEKDILEYPKELEVKREIKSVNRFKPAQFRGRGSKLILTMGFVIFILLAVRLIYSLGLIPFN